MRPFHRLLILPAMVSLGCEALSYYPDDCRDTATCPPPCPGQCVPLPPIDFQGPSLLWIGAEDKAPGCPTRAPKQVFEGYGDLNASNECPACECTPPACVFPSGLTPSSTPMCQGPFTPPYDAPVGWNGACISPGTVATLGSVSIAPVTVSPCTPVVSGMPTSFGSGSSWGTFARACAGEPIPDVCGDPGLTCMPTAEPPPPGFRQCIVYLRDGDPECPEDYPDEFLFYRGLEDTRDCTPCECTETAPSTCAASMAAYQSTNCTMPLFENYPIDTAMAKCVDTGFPLGSMKATWLINAPGTCAASGGLPVGEATPQDPRSFCCQPPP